MLAPHALRPSLLATALALCAGLAAWPGAAAAQQAASPRLLTATLANPSITGAPVPLTVRVAGRGAAPTGMIASFGGPDGSFGLSSCRADSAGGIPSAPYGPRSRVTLAAPHAYDGARPRPVTIRLDSGGCDAAGPSVAWPLAVTPNRAGEPRRPILFGTPLELPAPLGVGGAPDPGSLPDPGALFGPGPLPDSPVPRLPGVPTDPGAPVDPSLPDPGSLPDLGGLLTAGSAQRGRRCRGAGRRPGRSRGSRRRATGRTVCLINVERRRRGLRPLQRNGRLARAARAHARAMVRGRYFSHVQPGGVGLATRVARTGYISSRRRWTVGENLGFGQGRYSTPRQMVKAWMRSTPHRRAILEPRFRDLGVATVHGSPLRSRRRGTTYAVNFGVSRR